MFSIPITWIAIPNKQYSIAKHPVTNAQFADFIEANGYYNRQFWSDAGWNQRMIDHWTAPRSWQAEQFNDLEMPVVGVSWYEAIAFCVWLSELTGSQITLPTSNQWQYAAQGDDGRLYPWGDEWDASRCNHNVDKTGVGKITPVTRYEGKGESPFGVVDMAGNVWEWCMTDDKDNNHEIMAAANTRIIHGGSWDGRSIDLYRCDRWSRCYPKYGMINCGFRVVRQDG